MLCTFGREMGNNRTL